MKAILYKSNTGYTKKYAELLGANTGLPVYEAEEAAKHISKGENVLFLGWLKAGEITGYKRAAKNYRVQCVCAVGMGLPSDKQANEAKKRHSITDASVFYLQGGFDIHKLHGIYKMMMNIMIKAMTSSLEKKTDKSREDTAMLDLIKNGGDFVSDENLAPVIEWVRQNQG